MHLVVTSQGQAPQRHVFATSKAIVIGRDPQCDLVLDDLDVSRRHLTLAPSRGGWLVTDSSSNGTYLGETYLRQQSLELSELAELQVGPFRICLLQEQALETDEVSTELRRDIHRALLDNLDLAQLQRHQMDEAALRPQVLEALRHLLEERRSLLPATINIDAFVRDMADEVLGLGPLESLLADDSVSEIMVVDPQLIYAERNGRLEKTALRFTDDDSARAAIERIVTPLGRRIDESTPYVDARLKDGSRVNAIIKPLALRGACITIRKFTKNRLAIADLIAFGSMNAAMGRFLQRSVVARKNVVISGGTGSGKTTLLNVLSQSIPEHERIVTIEDAAELQLAQEHVVSLESRPPNMEGKGEVAIRHLLKNALRMRPDRILVGECRGGEAIDMLQAMNTGHDGSMTTTHANSPFEAIRRLETLVLMSGIDLPVAAIRQQIAGSVNLIVQQSRLSDGSRKVTSVAEVVGIDDDGHIDVREIFVFHRTGTSAEGKAEGRYVATGYMPSYLGELIRLGLVKGDDYL